MDNQEFVSRCQEIIAKKENEKNGQVFIEPKDIFVVWSCKTLQNNKAILSLHYKGAPIYETVFNGDNEEIYIIEYMKESRERHSVN